MDTDGLINVGKISGVFGVKGWIKVFSYTDPPDNILGYSPWVLQKLGGDPKTVKVVKGKTHAKSIIAAIDGIIDRDQAVSLLGWDIFITPAQLPKAAADEYYWRDLLGLKVINTQGQVLGTVDSLMETGSNDVLVVTGDRDRAIPFLQGRVIKKIDLETGTMTVDWDADF